MPRIAASQPVGAYGLRRPVKAWLSGSSAVAAIAKPMPRPMAMISAASQRHGSDLPRGGADQSQERELAAAPQCDHDQRVENGDRRESEDLSDELRAEPAVHFAVRIARADERGAVTHAEAGIA